MVSPFQLRLCRDTLNQGGVICYPTESVYGLGCDPLCETAVYKILTLKQRPVEKGLILVAANLDQIEPFTCLTAEQKLTIQQYDTAMTWLVPCSAFAPEWVRGSHPKIAIRISQHPQVKALCEYYGGAVVSTSANPGGARPATSSLMARRYFGERVDFYMSGDTGPVKLATPITDIETGKKYR